MPEKAKSYPVRQLPAADMHRFEKVTAAIHGADVEVTSEGQVIGYLLSPERFEALVDARLDALGIPQRTETRHGQDV